MLTPSCQLDIHGVESLYPLNIRQAKAKLPDSQKGRGDGNRLREKTVGTFSVTVEVGNIDGSEPMSIEALVDTGALHSMIPASILTRLHIQPQRHDRFELADGANVEYGVGTARMILEGRDGWCPVIFGPDADSLLGATTLEILNLTVDPIAQRLTPVKRRIRPI